MVWNLEIFLDDYLECVKNASSANLRIINELKHETYSLWILNLHNRSINFYTKLTLT